MNEIERLNGELARRFPGHRIEMDAPEVESGSWFLNVFRAGDIAPVVVEWRPDRGFGVTTPGPEDYGTGAAEAYTDAKATHDRVAQLILSGESSLPTHDLAQVFVCRKPTG